MPKGIYERTIEHNRRVGLSMLGIKNRLGYKSSEITKQRNAAAMYKRSENIETHPRYKGDKVGYNGLHKWVNGKLGKAKECILCEREQPVDRKRFFSWANVSGLYMRDLDDWVQLCLGCNIKYDTENRKIRKQLSV